MSHGKEWLLYSWSWCVTTKRLIKIAERKKRRMITFYNKSKEGVHTMEQMVGTYSCKYQTQSGPMVPWYNILDIATLNGDTFFRGQHPQFKSSVTSTRCIFVNEFSQELFTPHMRSWVEGCCNCKTNHWSNGKVWCDKCHNSATEKKSRRVNQRDGSIRCVQAINNLWEKYMYAVIRGRNRSSNLVICQTIYSEETRQENMQFVMIWVSASVFPQNQQFLCSCSLLSPVSN